MQNTIAGLTKKRGEIADQHKVAMKTADVLKADLDAIDPALVLCGYQDDPTSIAPRGNYKQLLIPTCIDQNSCAQSRRPMVMIFQGRSISRFHASQQ